MGRFVGSGSSVQRAAGTRRRQRRATGTESSSGGGCSAEPGWMEEPAGWAGPARAESNGGQASWPPADRSGRRGRSGRFGGRSGGLGRGARSGRAGAFARHDAERQADVDQGNMLEPFRSVVSGRRRRVARLAAEDARLRLRFIRQAVFSDEHAAAPIDAPGCDIVTFQSEPGAGGGSLSAGTDCVEQPQFSCR